MKYEYEMQFNEGFDMNTWLIVALTVLGALFLYTLVETWRDDRSGAHKKEEDDEECVDEEERRMGKGRG